MSSRSLPEVADVIVVGSGPSGSIVTQTLAAQGFSVICLEQGDWINASDFPGNHPEWELLIQERWAHDPNVRRRPADYPVDVADSDMWPVMYSGVGGRSLIFGGHWPRLMPSDFRVRSLDGIADDWPISYEDLRPYYEEVDRFIGVSGVDGDPAYPDGLEYPQPPLPIGKGGRRMAEAMNRLGWHWWPGVHAIPSFKTSALDACARYGVCEWGCPHSAKGSFDRTFLSAAMQAGAHVVTGARVARVTLDERGRANGVVWIDPNGTEHLQKAKGVVLCANGVGTPRLLLMSDQAGHLNGLANSSDLVGRNLMLHPNATVVGYYDEDLESYIGPAGQLISSHEFYETDLGNGFVRGAKWNLMPLPGPMTTIDQHRSRPFEEVWGESFHRVVRRHSSAMLWAANTEDLPEPTNRVTLSTELSDAHGLPSPKIHYRVSDNTRKMLRFAVDRMTQAHLEAGAIDVVQTEIWVDQPGHLLGTARMGNDPETSVVDSFGRSHDVPNLFVADGSLFVTGGAANPTNTISALALRVARHIADTAKDQEVPA